MLDLSAAFDTIDHDRLLTRMEYELGISGLPLIWFRSYLSVRIQCVQIEGSCSPPTVMHWAVPQGSILGPILFLIYMLPLGSIVRKHGLELHIYAHDTQIYVSVNPVTQRAVNDVVCKIQQCMVEVQQLMTENMLKLNAEKTEVKIFGSVAQLAKFSLDKITIGNATVCLQKEAVCNLGVILDTSLSQLFIKNM